MFKYKFVALALAMTILVSPNIAFADVIIPSRQEAKDNLKELNSQFIDMSTSVKNTITSYQSHKKPIYKDKQAYIESIKGYKEGYNNLLQKTFYWQDYLKETKDYNTNRTDLSGFNTLKNKILVEIKKLDSIIKNNKTK